MKAPHWSKKPIRRSSTRKTTQGNRHRVFFKESPKKESIVNFGEEHLNHVNYSKAPKRALARVQTVRDSHNQVLNIRKEVSRSSYTPPPWTGGAENSFDQGRLEGIKRRGVL